MTLTIDGNKYDFSEGETILDIANRNDIYIPTLCTHKDLLPFGACRMCLVEVEDRGILTSCTTPAEDGMSVNTDTEELNELKRNILEMILSEHPSACIVCEDRELCFKFHKEPTKAGRSTGCRFCPSRDECDLYEVADYLGIEDIGLEIEYRDYPLKRDEPFIERDYNLCILCGRCVRVCEEIRGVGAIAFTNRGYDTIIGTSFDEPLVDSRCIFCGACVDVCPTGALSENLTKWGVSPDKTISTYCSICPVGCGIDIEVKRDRVINSVPSEIGLNNGQLCVKGRFTIPTLVTHPDRLRYPMIKDNGALKSVQWEEAIKFAAERLEEYKPEEIGFLISPWLTNEAAYIIQKFARSGISTDNMEVASKMVNPSVDILQKAMTYCGAKGEINEIEGAETILIVGTDLNLSAPVLLPPINEAKKSGANVIIVDRSAKKIPVFIDQHVSPNDYLAFFGEILKKLSDDNSLSSLPEIKSEEEKKQAEEIADLLIDRKVAVIFGEDIFTPEESKTLALITNILSIVDEGLLIPAWDGGNIQGIIDVGALSGVSPGQKSFDGSDKRNKTLKESGIKALHLTQSIKDIPEDVEFVILQDIYSSELMEKADVVFPTTTFTETDGTITSLEGRIQEISKCAPPPGMAMDDWEIITKLAKELGYNDFDFSNAGDVTDEMLQSIPDMKVGLASKNKGFKFIKDIDQIVEFETSDFVKGELAYRGTYIGDKVEDFDFIIDAWGVSR